MKKPAYDEMEKKLAVLEEEVKEYRRQIPMLQENERKLKLILDTMPEQFALYDKDYRILFTNRYSQEIGTRIGRTMVEELTGRHCYEVWHNRDKICENCPVDKAINTRQLQQGEVTTPDGRTHLIFATAVFDEKGNVTGTAEYSKDITERKLIENALRESEAKFRSIIQNSNDAIYFLYEGKFEVVNNKFLEMLDINLEQTNSPKFNFMDFVAPQSKSLIEERDNQIVKGGEPKSRYEFTALTRQGKEIEVEASTSYVEYKKGVATLGVLRDVTDRKDLEKKFLHAQKMEAIGTLAGGVAHDFNNILTVINGNAELALLKIDKMKNEYLHKTVDTIFLAGQKAVALISQLLAFSRKQIYKAEIMEVNKALLSMDKMLHRLIGEDISLNMVLADNLPLIRADESQLDQVIINLIVNARDAVYAVSKPEYKKKITIETGRVELDEEYVSKHSGSNKGPHVFITVSDNGVGMDETTKQRIFEPFFTTKDKFGGTGLGLSTVYGIVKQNNGSIYIYTEPDAGTMFKIYWPVTKENRSVKEKKIKENQNLSGDESILFVEDDFDVREFSTEALRALGYKVFTAADGQEALRLIEKEKIEFDIILTDLIMPKLSGKEFIEKVKKIILDAKVVFVSGYTDNYIAHNGMLEEGVNFIQKPYTIKALAGQVRKVLDA